VISGETRLVGLLGDPVSGSLSPLMQNAAFAARALDWAYVPLAVPAERLEDALRGLVALRFEGANVTTPHKLAVATLLGAGTASVNTLVVRDGRLHGSSTDSAIIGVGGAAIAFAEALPGAARFSRRGTWPVHARDVDLVVNATSERDEILVHLQAGQTLIDLPYPRTATARAAQAAGARVVDGFDVLVAQGAAAFRLWTEMPAPVEIMRSAIRT